jgi:CheY-like chemotaxis protein
VAEIDRPFHVLLIEDHRDTADTLAALLCIEGYEVAIARTGPDGVEAAGRLRPDVILCDIGLPGFDGFEVARRVRQGPAGGVLLVAITAYGLAVDRLHALDAGFNVFITKPADPEAILKLLSDARGWMAAEETQLA